MALFVLFFGLSVILGVANSSQGCSDYGCSCHPDEQCDPVYAKDNPCHQNQHNCFGPVITTMFATKMNKTIASSLLPTGLQLGTEPDNWPYPNEWPIQFFFAQQHNVGNDLNYLEFMLMIGYIEWNDEEAPKYKYHGPFGFAPKVYLNNLDGLIGGRICGLNKQMANLTQSCDMNGNCDYYINALESEDKILSAQWSPQPLNNGVYLNATSVSNFWEYQRPVFDLPVIDKYPVATGACQCNVANWFLDTALIEPVTGQFTIHQDFYGLLPTGTFKADQTIIQDPWFGAYRMETMWIMYNDQYSACDSQNGTCANFEPAQFTF